MAISDYRQTRVGKILEAERRARGWSHQEVANQAGCSPSTWNVAVYGGRVDHGEFKAVRTSPQVLASLAMVLGLDTTEVLKAAGYKTVPDDIVYNLEPVPTEQLTGELIRRGHRVTAARRKSRR